MGVNVDTKKLRPDLASAIERHQTTLDAARPEAVARRRKTGQAEPLVAIQNGGVCRNGELLGYLCSEILTALESSNFGNKLGEAGSLGVSFGCFIQQPQIDECLEGFAPAGIAEGSSEHGFNSIETIDVDVAQ